jgi:hypothetical protein
MKWTSAAILLVVLVLLAAVPYTTTYWVRWHTSRCADVVVPESYTTNFAWPGHAYRQLVFDMFLRQGSELVLVSTYYGIDDADFATEVTVQAERSERSPQEYDDVSSTSGNWETLQLSREVGASEREPARALVYRCVHDPTQPVRVRITFRGGKRQVYTLTPDSVPPSLMTPPPTTRGGVAIATLFKNDYDQIPTWYEYYKSQGVSRFYLYYNGDLNVVQDKLNKLALAGAGAGAEAEISYHAWPFRYWTKPEGWLQWPYEHHAQMAFLTAARMRYLPLHDWLIMGDLDEFIHSNTPSQRLSEYLQAHEESPYVMVANTWAYEPDKTTSASASASAEFTIVANWRPLPCPWRSKVIYNGRRYQGLFGIHQPKGDTLPSCTTDLSMYHVAQPQHTDRRSRVRPGGPTVRLLSPKRM